MALNRVFIILTNLPVAGSLFRRANSQLLQVALNRTVRTNAYHLQKIGSDYGGWIVPSDRVDSSSICYCVGAGEDITFDIGLIEKYGCEIFSFDPTPRAIRHMENIAGAESRYRFFAKGLWSSNCRMRFYAPRNPKHVSHAIVNLQGTSDYFEAECDRLSNIMKSLGHTRLDLLKLDIEGAEWVVLDSILEDRLDVRTLCVDFEPTLFVAVVSLVLRLRRAGHILADIDGWNFTFIR